LLTRSGGSAVVELGDGSRAHVANAGAAIPDQKVSIVVRPEDMMVNAPGEDRNVVRATLGEVTYLGAATRLVAQLGDQTLTVMCNRPASQLRTGDSVDLAWDPAHCSLIAEG
jgi:ABC-type Fe3+/spermidine/putrescine transport system ATPase subunit